MVAKIEVGSDSWAPLPSTPVGTEGRDGKRCINLDITGTFEIHMLSYISNVPVTSGLIHLLPTLPSVPSSDK